MEEKDNSIETNGTETENKAKETVVETEEKDNSTETNETENKAEETVVETEEENSAETDEDETENKAEEPVVEIEEKKPVNKKKIFLISGICLAAAVVVAGIIALCVLLAGGGVKNMDKDYAKSVEKATQVVKTTELKDGEILVNSQEETLVFTDKDNAAYTVKTKKLDDYKKELVEKTSRQNVEVERSSLAIIKLDAKLFERGYTYKKNVFNGVVKSDKTASVMGEELAAQIVGDVKVTVTFSGKKVAEVKCSFLTKSGKNAELTVTYSYGK